MTYSMTEPINTPWTPKDGPDALIAVLRVLSEVGAGAVFGFMLAGAGGSIVGTAVTIVAGETVTRHFFPPEHLN